MIQPITEGGYPIRHSSPKATPPGSVENLPLAHLDGPSHEIRLSVDHRDEPVAERTRIIRPAAPAPARTRSRSRPTRAEPDPPPYTSSPPGLPRPAGQTRRRARTQPPASLHEDDRNILTCTVLSRGGGVPAQSPGPPPRTMRIDYGVVARCGSGEPLLAPELTRLAMAHGYVQEPASWRTHRRHGRHPRRPARPAAPGVPAVVRCPPTAVARGGHWLAMRRPGPLDIVGNKVKRQNASSMSARSTMERMATMTASTIAPQDAHPARLGAPGADAKTASGAAERAVTRNAVSLDVFGARVELPLPSSSPFWPALEYWPPWRSSNGRWRWSWRSDTSSPTAITAGCCASSVKRWKKPEAAPSRGRRRCPQGGDAQYCFPLHAAARRSCPPPTVSACVFGLEPPGDEHR